MSDNTVTFALDGDVTIDQFIKALQTLQQTVELLSREIAPGAKIDWLIEDLKSGSAVTTLVGESTEQSSVIKIVKSYEKLGRALQNGDPIPFSPQVTQIANQFPKLISRKITAIRFETSTQDYVVYSPESVLRQSQVQPRVSFGVVKGVVQTLTTRGKLKFTLYDAVFDKAVSCYLQPEYQLQMIDIWDKEVQVAGRVTRQATTGQPVIVRDITSITPVVKPQKGSFRNARGLFDWQAGDERAEITIWRVRDGEN